LKADGLLGRNFLKGTASDAINALLCGAGHNLRKILARIRLFCLDFWQARTHADAVQAIVGFQGQLVGPRALLSA